MTLQELVAKSTLADAPAKVDFIVELRSAFWVWALPVDALPIEADVTHIRRLMWIDRINGSRSQIDNKTT